MSELQIEPESPPIILSAPRPAKHRHHEDAYESPPGAMPRVTREEPAPPTRANLALAADIRADQESRAARYDRYLELLAFHGGDAAPALAELYGLEPEEARARMRELHADVRSGIGNSELAPILERADLDLQARVRVLRGHVYSHNPAASLKALDMLQDLEGGGSAAQPFEMFLRLAKGRKGT